MSVPRVNRVAVKAARGLLFAALLAPAVYSQTLQQAMDLWKQHDLMAANDIFRGLVDKNPDNAEYHVLWGRLFLEHAKAEDIQTASDLFNEALKLKKDDPGALVGLALIEAANYGSKAGPLAQKALESDPNYVEAYELLARLALEDNNNSRAVGTCPQGAFDRSQGGAGQGDSGQHGLAGRQEGHAMGSARCQRLRDRRPLLHAEPAL